MTGYPFPKHVSDRVVARRGRLHAYDQIEPARTALLVVDLQVHFMREGSTSEMPSAREIVPKVNRLAAELRRHGGHVVWIISTYGPNEEDRWSNLFDNVMGPEAAQNFRDGLTEGNAGHAIWPDLDVEDGDPVVDKNRFGGFLGSGGRLQETLDGLGVDTVLIVGTVTNVCCESTAREAASFNYKTVMVCDANAGRSDQADLETYNVFIAAYGDVMTTDEVIERLGPA